MTDPGDVNAIHRREDLEFVAAGVFVVAVIWAVYSLGAGAPQPPAVFCAHTLLALALAGRYLIWPRWWGQTTPRSYWTNLLTLLIGIVAVFVIDESAQFAAESIEALGVGTADAVALAEGALVARPQAGEELTFT